MLRINIFEYSLLLELNSYYLTTYCMEFEKFVEINVVFFEKFMLHWIITYHERRII